MEVQKKGEVVEKKETGTPAVSEPTDMKSLIEKNIKWTQAVYEQNQKILHRMTMTAIAGYLRILLILVPLILSIIFLPRILGPVFEQYQQLLGGMGGVNSKQIDIQQIIKQYQDTLK